ncbi:thiamine pyrophosphate-binding protein [Thalassospiraceae bacterium LMO-JJ14]|nr:thiamine pyrophosphate-binding protein [Thalassospiraceae bacterium LMO-JJ14]
MRTGGQMVVEALVANGVDRVFCVPGESYLAVLDALYDVSNQIKVTVCRQEGGAANMAEAYGKLTGKPGVVMVTRGPGATNASIGVHTGFQDSTPMIVLVGQVARDQADREAFQEIDYRRMFGQMAKWVAEIEDTSRVPEYMSRAFQTALAGRPGPVVLALPEDMLSNKADAPETKPVTIARPGVAAKDVEKFRARLATAKRPLIMAGGGGWTPQATAALTRFAEANNIAVSCAFRRQDCFDNTHPLYAGHVGIGADPKLIDRVRTADPLIVIGPRLGEMTTGGYELLKPLHADQPLVHVHPSGEELNRVYAAELPIQADVTQFLEACADMAPLDSVAWADDAKAAHADYMAFTTPAASSSDVDMGSVMETVRELLPDDAIVTNGAGNYAIWVHRYYRYRKPGTQLAPTSGAMGYGVPAAVAAKLEHPNRVVVSFAGDGCFQMNCNELGTAMQYGANVIFIVVNNSMYGTIRMHQERRFPDRISATDIINPNFPALCEAYGGKGYLVTKTAGFRPALEDAIASDRMALIEIRIDPEDIAPGRRLSEL